MRTAVILTAYNRPTLVRDAIGSVMNQRDDNVRLIIADDGSNADNREAIEAALGAPTWVGAEIIDCVGGTAVTTYATPKPVTWWKGPNRSMTDRKASIPYSRTINIVLNHLLRDEKYIAYLCDDDAFYPESIDKRADYLDAHPDVHVVYGRLRAVQYARDGYNTWTSADRPVPGMHFPRPSGPRVQIGEGGKRCFFANNGCDPQTGLPYVEEGYWEPGPLRYGQRGATDHNQVMHRVECLRTCRDWPRKPDGSVEYWGEDVRHGVGDAAFFRLLGETHSFEGVDVWTVTKKYHAFSDGASNAEVRE